MTTSKSDLANYKRFVEAMARISGMSVHKLERIMFQGYAYGVYAQRHNPKHRVSRRKVRDVNESSPHFDTA